MLDILGTMPGKEIGISRIESPTERITASCEPIVTSWGWAFLDRRIARSIFGNFNSPWLRATIFFEGRCGTRRSF
jgi:hypothetical protein